MESPTEYIIVVGIFKFLESCVFISLISDIVCSLQTFLIAPIHSVAVRLKISGCDDKRMTS